MLEIGERIYQILTKSYSKFGLLKISTNFVAKLESSMKTTANMIEENWKQLKTDKAMLETVVSQVVAGQIGPSLIHDLFCKWLLNNQFKSNLFIDRILESIKCGFSHSDVEELNQNCIVRENYFIGCKILFCLYYFIVCIL